MFTELGKNWSLYWETAPVSLLLWNGEHKSWDWVSLFPTVRNWIESYALLNCIHYASLMPNVLLCTLLRSSFSSLTKSNLGLFRLGNWGLERYMIYPEYHSWSGAKFRIGKVSPCGSKAHASLPTSPNALPGQEEESQPLWECLRTLRAMLTETEVRSGSHGRGDAQVGCHAHTFHSLPQHSLEEKRKKENPDIYSFISRTELTACIVMLLPQIEKAVPKPRLLALGTHWIWEQASKSWRPSGFFNSLSRIIFFSLSPFSSPAHWA